MLGSATIGIRFWRWRAGNGGISVKPLEGAVEARFSPDGKSILAATPMYFTGGNLYYHRHHYYPPESAAILNAVSGAEISTIEEPIYSASWSSDGKEIIATPATGNAIQTYEVESGKPTSRRFPGHTGRFTISQYSPSRKRLVSFSSDKTIRVFDYTSGVRLHEQSPSEGKRIGVHRNNRRFFSRRQYYCARGQHCSTSSVIHKSDLRERRAIG